MSKRFPCAILRKNKEKGPIAKPAFFRLDVARTESKRHSHGPPVLYKNGKP